MERHPSADGTISCGRCFRGRKQCLWPVAEPAGPRFVPYSAALGPSTASSAINSSSSNSDASPLPAVPTVSPLLSTPAPEGSASTYSGALMHEPLSEDDWIKHLLSQNEPSSLLDADASSAPHRSLDLGLPSAASEHTLGQNCDNVMDGIDGLPAELFQLATSQLSSTTLPLPLSQQANGTLSRFLTPMYLAPTSAEVQLWPDQEERNLVRLHATGSLTVAGTDG